MVISDKRYQEIGGIVVLLMAAILLLSLLTFHVMDADLLSAGRPVRNTIGPFGAWTAWFLRSAFGYSAYLISAVCVLAGWEIVRKGSLASSLERIFSLIYLTVTSSALLALFYPTNVPQFSGGVTGIAISRLFDSLLSKTGSCLVIVILNIIGLILLGLFSVDSVLESSGRRREQVRGAFSSLRAKTRKKKKADVPLNHIERDVKKRKGEKLPWITRKTIRLYPDDPQPEADPFAERRLLPLQSPVYGFGGFSEVPLSHIDEGLARNEKLLKGDGEWPRETAPAVSGGNSLSMYRDLLARRIERSVTGDGYDELSGHPDGDGDTIARSDEMPAVQAVETAASWSETGGSDMFTGAQVLLGPDGGAVSVTAGPAPEARMREADAIIPPAADIADEPADFDDDADEAAPLTAGPGEVVERVSFFPDDSGQIHFADQRPDAVFQRISLSGDYDIPTSYLTSSAPADLESWKNEIRRNSELLVRTLQDFGIESRVINVNRGPVITLYEMQIAPGIKVNRIVGLSDDIAMALAASRVRIVAPIPGKSAIGVEVPNLEREMVTLGDIIKSNEYRAASGKLKVALGEDILGVPVTLDIKKLPHLLIAGSTGSGKSVCVNSIITSLIYNYSPNHVRFILVDPKMVELQLYNGMPHLLTPVITEPHLVPKALKWATVEMERRYRLLSELHTRDIDRYNEKAAQYGGQFERLPYVVIIMDELADLMMVAAKEIEGFITRIAQKARAIGIHLVLATQRPSVDVITGIIKANFPARIAFQVAQKTDSRTIIDQNGAEKLLGKGDMLYQSPMSSFPVRIQGAFISEDEVIRIVQHLRRLGKPAYIDIESAVLDEEDEEGYEEEFNDELFREALKIVEETKKASASYLQRRLSIGYNRAARMIEMMEEKGLVGPQQGSKPREVYL